MKTKKVTILGFLLALFGSVVIISCKDDFTEQDLINAQGVDSVQLSIVVFNGSTSNMLKGGKPSGSRAQGLASMTVSITNAQGKLITKTTDGNGIANFRALEPGSVSGVVSGTDFTTANFVISIANTSPDDPFTSAGVIVPVFETAGPNTGTLTGTATAELDLLNDGRENVPDGTKVSFTIFQPPLEDGTELAFLTSLLGGSASGIALRNADVTSITYQGNFVASVTNGTFTAVLPTSPDGLTYEIEFSDFVADQAIAVNNFENTISGSLRNVQAVSTLFAQSTSNLTSLSGPRYDIPGLSPVQFDIDAPPAQGSGAVVSAKLIPAEVDAANGFIVLARGSGYPASSTTIPVTVVGGDFDSTVPGAAAAVLTASSNAAGQIVSIGGTTGFGYRSRATLTIGGGGSGAVAVPDYTSTVADPYLGSGATGGTIITAVGSGYVVAPNVVFRGIDGTGQVVDVAATGEVVSNGGLIDFTPTGAAFASLTSTIVIPATRNNASVDSYLISSTGVITSVTISSTPGSGYNPLAPPGVTVRDLRTPGGSNAQIFASTSASGIVDAILVATGGTGYTTTSLANFPSSFEPFSFATTNDGGDLENTATIIVMRPGVTRHVQAHYGTGIHAVGLL